MVRLSVLFVLLTTAKWAHGVNGPSRLPPRGPRTPHSSATVAVVSQDMQLHVCFLRRSAGVLGVLSCSLSIPDEFTEDVGSSFERPTQGPEGVRICSVAAIGMAYNGRHIHMHVHNHQSISPLHSEDSFLVATVSKRLPYPAAEEPGLSLDSMSMGINMTDSLQSEPTVFNDWDRLGNDSIIEIAEARLGTVGGSPHLST